MKVIPFLAASTVVLMLGGCDSGSSKKASTEASEDEIPWVKLESGDWEELPFGGEGSAQWHGETLHLDAGVELTGSKFVGEEMPKIPYEISLQARKMTGSDFFCGLTFPVRPPEECLTFIVGGWGGGTVGISSIDGANASMNDTTTYANFEDERWYEIRVLVTGDHLQGFIDGESVFDISTAGKKLSLRTGSIDLCAPLGLASWQTAAEFRDVKWRPLD